MDKYAILKDVFGHSAFRQGQEEMIDGIMLGRDVMGIMPTGAGKSVCYQLPALLMQGITVVVSPLISLMKDQVAALVQMGIKAAYINSSLTKAQYNEVFKRANQGLYKIIYVAPERLQTLEFLSFSQDNQISMVTVDEAHCVSQWGQDFRPSYLKIADYISALPKRPVVSAFTATATKQVRDDIVELLRLNEPVTAITGFDRKNLYFSVMKPQDKFLQLKSFLEDNKDKCGIIYCLARKTVEEVCERLIMNGYSATRYHAGLTEEERHKNQDDFIFDRCNIMVATNAFGMGIDKSNVGFVVHYNMPKNMESYYQEAGRAGRDGSDAQCLLLYSGQDVRVNQFLIEKNDDNEELTPEQREIVRQRDLERLRQMTYYCTTTRCLREFMLNYFGEKAPTRCENCSNCSGDFNMVEATDEAIKILTCVNQLAERNLHFGKTMIFDILHGESNDRISRMHLASLACYGTGGLIPTDKLRRVCDYLTDNGYLIVDDKYSTLVYNSSADAILMGKMSITIKQPKNEVQRRSTRYDKNAPVNAELFAELKALRLQLASKLHVPAYVIFTDVTLKDMCRKLPMNYEELLKVSGVGAVKAKRYGSRFCKLIIAYEERKNKS